MQDRPSHDAGSGPEGELRSPLDRIVQQLRASPAPADALTRALASARCLAPSASVWMRALLRGEATVN